MKKLRLFLAEIQPPSQYSQMTPPLGLLYLAAYLRERFSLDITIVHQGIEQCTSGALARMAVDFNPDIAGLRSLTPSAHALPYITGAIKSALPDTLIVLGGPHVAAYDESALAPTSADLAVSGEGELAMEHIVEAYLNRDSYEKIPGLIRRTKDGYVVKNEGEEPFIQDLDQLPFPAYDLIDMPKYWKRLSMTLIPRRYCFPCTSLFYCGDCLKD